MGLLLLSGKFTRNYIDYKLSIILRSLYSSSHSSHEFFQLLLKLCMNISFFFLYIMHLSSLLTIPISFRFGFCLFKFVLLTSYALNLFLFWILCRLFLFFLLAVSFTFVNWLRLILLRHSRSNLKFFFFLEQLFMRRCSLILKRRDWCLFLILVYFLFFILVY